MKKCPRCNKIKSLDQFNKNRCRKDGYNVYCKICKKIADKVSLKKNYKKRQKTRHNFWKKNKKILGPLRKIYRKSYYTQHRDNEIKNAQSYRQKNIDKVRFYEIKNNARKRNYEFNISYEEVVRVGKQPCAYCGCNTTTIGIDRINNKKGYIKGNIASSCFTCNRMKDVYTKKHFISHCRAIVKHNKTKEGVK